MNLNKVMLLGSVGKNPETGTSNGEAFATFRLATIRAERDTKSRIRLRKTDWHWVFTLGKLAEVVKQYIRSGDRLYVEGRLEYRALPDQGQLRTVIVCTNLIMLGSTRKHTKTKENDGEG